MDNTRYLEDHCVPQARRLVQPLSAVELVPLVDRDYYHPMEIFALSKQLDAAPGVYGTFPLAGERARTFLHQREPQRFYEPFENTAQILDVMMLNDLFVRGRALPGSVPGILVAFQAFNSIFTAPGGRVPLPAPGETSPGFHQVMLTGHWENPGPWLHFLNWWGPGWGEEGFGYLSREYLDQYLFEAWLAWNAGLGPSLLSYPQPRERGYQLFAYELFSLVERCPVQVIELRTAFHVRAAWAYIFHLRGNPPTSVLKELFVWPPFRRQGLGSMLEAEAVESARRHGANRLKILLYEMDAQPMAQRAGERFGRKSGYRWRWGKNSRPQLDAVGVKTL